MPWPEYGQSQVERKGGVSTKGKRSRCFSGGFGGRRMHAAIAPPDGLCKIARDRFLEARVETTQENTARTAFDEIALAPSGETLANVRAAVEEYNAARLLHQARAHRRKWGMLGLYAVACATAFFSLDEQIAGFGVLAWAQHPVRRARQALRDRILPQIFGFVGAVAYSHGARPPFSHAFDSLKLALYDSDDYGDIITGVYEGTNFAVAELSLRHGKTPVFRGVLLCVHLSKAFPGRLIGIERPSLPERFVRVFTLDHWTVVPSGSPERDGAHEFRSDNPAAAKAVLRGSLLKALQHLSETWPAGTVRLGLASNDCFLLIPTKHDFFELPDIGEEIDCEQHVLRMIRELLVLLATAKLAGQIGWEELLPGETLESAD
ncbi:hypothetical protein [Sinorhizobium psoraleae]|uniref:hypothetical protein n=1 Tax=Sinorhizobium psoraleae TaxID=520838 RepID=UPI0022B006ED|nr:hypothetical protein [Sinorhizobium psoraleae]